VVLYALFGLIMGAFFPVAALFRADGGGIAPLRGVAAVVVSPVLYGVGGVELDLR